MPKKILIVDDEPHIRETIKDRLEFAGYTVITACNGQEGLEKVENEKPDLIILDILMPVKDGYTFVKELKSKEEIKDIPIIVISGKDTLKILFETEGITDYIVKPIDAKELLEKIDKRLEGLK